MILRQTLKILLKFQKDASDLIYKSLNLSHKLALRDDVLGVINCPIDKKLLRKNQYGVTEFFSQNVN